MARAIASCFAPMIAVRDPTEVSRNRSFEILPCCINAPHPGFELDAPQLRQQSAGWLQAVTKLDGTPTPSGMATPRLSGS
jgi:hypothetical protein